MQNFICAILIIAATIYVANRWLPARFKQPFFKLFGKPMPVKASGGCSACSSSNSCSKVVINKLKSSK